MGSHPLAPDPDDPLALGERRDAPGEAVRLPVSALLRHVMALGSSGSGKTVFCKVLVEEAALRGIPVIAIDPQGDLASLALAPEAVEAARADDTDPDPADGPHDETAVDDWAGVGSLAGAGSLGGPETAAAPPPPALHDRVDVVVFTPASRRGVPLSADPVQAETAELGPAARVRAFTRTAGRIVSLLGYDLDGDEGAGLLAVFDRCLNEMADEGRPATNLRAVTERLEQLAPADLERYGRYLNERKIRAACQRLARLDVGARRLLFHDGVPIDIDLLLGRTAEAAPPAGKTRVSIIYLNTLEAQEDKDFVVATIADRLVSWMLRNPRPELQALFYIDEVAPFMPPVRKPACKEDLQQLFKQARKFGVGCVVATQNPGDVDYKAMGQFGTWALGRLATRQDLKKVEPAVRSLMPGAAPVLEEVPSLRPGELVLLSPDSFDEPCQLATRWLHTEHRTLDEERIDRMAGPWRDRFAGLDQGADGGRPVTIELLDEDIAAASASGEPVAGAGQAGEAIPAAEADRDRDPEETLHWIRDADPGRPRARATDREPDGDRDEKGGPAHDPAVDRAAERGPDRAAERGPDRAAERDRAADRDRAPLRSRNRAAAPVQPRRPVRDRRSPVRDRGLEGIQDRVRRPSHAPQPTPGTARPPVREVPLPSRDVAGDEPDPRAPAGAREPTDQPDPSWAWPRDPELAWMRARDTEPAWAPSPSPPAPPAPPGSPDLDPSPVPDRGRGRGREPSAGARHRTPHRDRARGRRHHRAGRSSESDRLSGPLGPPPSGPMDKPVLPAGRVADDTDVKLHRLILVLGAKLSMTAQEFAQRAGISERGARAKLKALVAAGHAGEFREQRTVRYWARSSGARPDLGMKARVLTVQPRVDHGTAESIGRSLVKTKVLGIIGQGETFAEARLVYRLVYRVGFQEKVKRPLLGRLVGPSHEERLGSLYVHPRTLDVLLFSADAGIRFAIRLPDHASEVEDLDGVVTFLEVRPGDISFDEEEWTERFPPALARKRVRESFGARPGAVTQVFVPLWQLLLRRGAGDSYRVETIDALVGRPVDWPERL